MVRALTSPHVARYCCSRKAGASQTSRLNYLVTGQRHYVLSLPHFRFQTFRFFDMILISPDMMCPDLAFSCPCFRCTQRSSTCTQQLTRQLARTSVQHLPNSIRDLVQRCFEGIGRAAAWIIRQLQECPGPSSVLHNRHVVFLTVLA